MGVNQNIAKGQMFLAVISAAALALPPACQSTDRGARAHADASTPRTDYSRAGLPVIDIHTHLAPDATGVILPLFDRRNIRYAVNLSGGYEGMGLEDSLMQQQMSGGRIIPFCNLPWRQASDPNFATAAVQILERCHALGIKGLKIQKVFGLVAQDTDGSRLHVDSPRLDPIFEAVGRLGMVVLIHVGDPKAFFQPPTPQNERWEELSQHPSWSFYGNGYPTFDQILTEFENLVLRHPNTTFIGAHFGNDAEEPERVAHLLERAPNYYIDTAARVPEFGRHPAAQMKAFFTRWQDHIVFGTDLGLSDDPSRWVMGSGGENPTTPQDVDRFFSGTWRYFESADPNIESPTPIQGRWSVHGVELPRAVLAKIYGGNAARLLHLPWPPPG